MTDHDLGFARAAFTTSSYCSQATCVGVRFLADAVVVANTTLPAGPIISATDNEWNALLDLIQDGDCAPTTASLKVILASNGQADLELEEITISYSAEEWRDFVRGVQAGEMRRHSLIPA
ncbi:MAG: DUF397 domain-containing protein [Acidimicrobiales bacterium]